MSADDRARWDARYQERAARARAGVEPHAEPTSFLAAIEPHLPGAGRALDVAGGAGRFAVPLAARGLEVVLVDISAPALELAAGRARAAGVSLELVCADLDDPAALPDGPFALIFIHHFLDRRLFPHLAVRLAPGGLWAMCHPTRRNLERHPRPGEHHLLDEGELATSLADLGLEIVSATEGWTPEGRHEARVIARRTASGAAEG